MLKEYKGITLIALIITIIVLLILAGVSISVVVGDNGVLTQAMNGKTKTDKAALIEKIQMEYSSLLYSEEAKDMTSKEKFELLETKLNDEGLEYNAFSRCMIIETRDENYLTVLENGEVLDGKHAYLDIADGSIDLSTNSFSQGTLSGNSLTDAQTISDYDGDYIITGETTENIIWISGTGTFNIEIRDLSINVTEKGLCAFDANKGSKTVPTYVNLTLSGNNLLYSGSGAGITFVCSNYDDISSTLTIYGDGYLDSRCKNGFDGAGIGGYYTVKPVGNIVINSGKINAIGRNDGCGIGGGLREPINNITINGGTIYAQGGHNEAGIGKVDTNTGCVTINNGNVTVVGGEYGDGIDSNKIFIYGGIIKTNVWRS